MMQYQTGPSYADNDEGMRLALAEADLASRVDECPAAIWARSGWLAVSTVAPDAEDYDTREMDGWVLVGVVDVAA